MKKISLLFVFLILICTTILSGCTKPDNDDVVLKSENTTNAETGWQIIKNNGVIKIGIEVESLPFIEKSSDGKYTGFLAELADSIVEKADIEAEFVEIQENNVATLLQNGNIDIVMNGYTEADTKNNQIRWMNPYISNHFIIVCKSSENIMSKEDLTDKKIGVVDETLSHITAINDGNINNDQLVKYSSEKEALNALTYNKINALIIEDSYFYYYRKNNNSNYVILDEIVHTHTRSIGMKKDNDELYEEMQIIIDELISDGTMEKLSNKWFVSNLTK